MEYPLGLYNPLIVPRLSMERNDPPSDDERALCIGLEAIKNTSSQEKNDVLHKRCTRLDPAYSDVHEQIQASKEFRESCKKVSDCCCATGWRIFGAGGLAGITAFGLLVSGFVTGSPAFCLASYYMSTAAECAFSIGALNMCCAFAFDKAKHNAYKEEMELLLEHESISKEEFMDFVFFHKYNEVIAFTPLSEFDYYVIVCIKLGRVLKEESLQSQTSEEITQKRIKLQAEEEVLAKEITTALKGKFKRCEFPKYL